MQMKYSVGDEVWIKDTPQPTLHFGWAELMTEYCGKKATITVAQKSIMYEISLYRIDLDGGRYCWGDICFEEDSCCGNEIEDVAIDSVLCFKET